MLKNLFKPIVLSLLIIGSFTVVCFADPLNNGGNDDFEFPRIKNPTCEDCIDLPVDIPSDDDSIMVQLLSVFGLNNDALSGDHKFIKYVRGILNLALGLLSMVALVMTIYTFYMMFFSDNEAGAKKAKGNLVGIFIALAVIGLAWLIVSFIFWRYQNNWEGALAS